MKNLIFIFCITFISSFAFGQVEEGDTLENRVVESTEVVDNSPEAVADKIGKIKTFEITSDTSVTVTNFDEETFVLIGTDVGQLVVTLFDGYNEIKADVGEDGKLSDWVLALIKWLLGGSLASVVALGGRTFGALKGLFSKIEKNSRLVVAISGVISLAWQLIQGGSFQTIEFWGMFGVNWFSFSMFAFGVYAVIFRNAIGKTPKTEAEQEKELQKAEDLLAAHGATVKR